MSEIISLKAVEDVIISLRSQNIILDKDVAGLYGVETKEINQAVKNNPDKFPDGYLFKLSNEEMTSLRSKILTLKTTTRGQHSKYNTNAFTEKGLYMLATILKSTQATKTTIAIVDTFAQLRELSRNIQAISGEKDERQQKHLIQKSSEIISDLLGDELYTSDTETSLELNFAVLKLKHTVKRKPRK